MPNWPNLNEHRWSSAKKAAAKSKGKSVESLKDDDFRLVNYIYHKMDKTEEGQKMAEKLKKELLAPPKPTSTAVPNPAKTGGQSVIAKMPKTGIPNMGKSEDLEPKKTSIEKLREFLNRIHSK